MRFFASLMTEVASATEVSRNIPDGIIPITAPPTSCTFARQSSQDISLPRAPSHSNNAATGTMITDTILMMNETDSRSSDFGFLYFFA